MSQNSDSGTHRLQELLDEVEELAREALRVRFESIDGEPAPTLPDSGVPVQEVLDSLVRVRRRLDRVEGILVRAISIAGQIARMATVVEAQASEKWDEALVSDPRINSGGFVAPKEKYAQANLAVMGVRRKAQVAATAVRVTSDAVEVVRVAHRGLDSLRYDHVVMIRAATVMTSLEG